MTTTSRKIPAAGGAFLALALAGCVVGPDYAKPQLTPPVEFRGGPSTGSADSIADRPWRAVFDDPALQALVDEGLANNQDLAVAMARIERARALVGVARSEGKPQLNYRVGAGAENTFVPDNDETADTVTFGTIGGALEAAWELDVWGRIRRSTEAARANLAEQEDVRRAVELTLVADIATSYYRLLELDREAAIAQESAGVYRQTLDLFTRRFEAGRDTRLPVERAAATYESSTARVEDVRRQIAIEENALSVLVGGYPKAIPRGRPLLDQPLPETPLGTTTALLQRRPDILAAEQRMIAANAQVGVAVANKFPRIGLSALAGGLDANVEGNWEGFGVWNLAMSAAGPIFDGGRTKSIEAERRAHWDETVAQYRKTVLVAFQETSNALAAQDALARRRAALQSQVNALRRSFELAMTRYDAGRASYFEVLEAQQQLFPSEYALAQVQGEQLIAYASLYKALGGGWSATGTGSAPPPPS